MQTTGKKSNGHVPPWSDFITDFIASVAGTSSPDIFKRWAGIALVAGALERRVWLSSARGKTYPNLYVLLMASPGIGKHVVEDARRLWRDARSAGGTKAFHVAPDQMTKASLMDRLASSKSAFIPPSGPIQTFHSLLIAAEEFGVLFPSYDGEYLGSLNKIWNVEDLYEETRRTGSVKELSVERPLINILAGYQPALMATTFPDEAWSSGLARRIIMVYSATSVYRDLFDYLQEGDIEALRLQLLSQLQLMAGMWGCCLWTPEAAIIAAGSIPYF